ncbi:hypothetical protein GJU39_13490 [Pedobacter petrophilus]|uniref:Uncharacterized protein n=1 Tax=Pedobacter petrophilus TaxID=1908241 RepID=A0A7K0G0Z6_9SPHI|nr:hypothetical protein [Pedobacter petrophilus]MRX77100.1 hypothetical protein [Pedobacter petrophilus]
MKSGTDEEKHPAWTNRSVPYFITRWEPADKSANPEIIQLTIPSAP